MSKSERKRSNKGDGEKGKTTNGIPVALRVEADETGLTKRRIRGIIFSRYKPSLALQYGIGSLRQAFNRLRSDHRRRLWVILRRLMRRNNLGEACGVLSVLLKGSRKETSLVKNRRKYTAAIELLARIKGEHINCRKIQGVYDLWMQKVGFLKNWSIKERLAIQLEFVLLCLSGGNVDDAHQGVIGLMQERGFGKDPVPDLVVGLTFFQLWWCSIPEWLRLKEVEESFISVKSEMSETEDDMSIDSSNGKDSVQEVNFSAPCDSKTSVRIGKDLGSDINRYAQVAYNKEKEQFYSKSEGISSQQETSASNPNGGIPKHSIFYAQGLHPWLLPLRLPLPNKNIEFYVDLQNTLHNDYYDTAVKHLRLALHSTPPVYEALHPLVQMLLAGDHAHEALAELEACANSSGYLLALRLKAYLLEHLDSNNYIRLSACFEDIFMKDPTCIDSLQRLIRMNQSGDYRSEKLVEMVALHLDASYAESNTWKVFSSCLLNVSQSEEDRISLCLGGDEGVQEQSSSLNRLPGIFVGSESRDAWIFRCRWWLTRHFSQTMLSSDVASGDLGLLTYKAACACHLYSQDLEYVVKASTYIEEEKDRDLFTCLLMHKESSIGFYSNLEKKT